VTSHHLRAALTQLKRSIKACITKMPEPIARARESGARVFVPRSGRQSLDEAPRMITQHAVFFKGLTLYGVYSKMTRWTLQMFVAHSPYHDPADQHTCACRPGRVLEISTHFLLRFSRAKPR
jgi:hypothetical protein